MTEAELYEQIAMYMGNCIAAFTMYVSLTFAYLTVAYLVAARLTTFQAIASTVMYACAALSCVATLLTSLSFIGVFGDKLAVITEYRSVVLFSDSDVWVIAMGAMMTAGIFASAYFFYTVRKPETKA